MTLSHHEARTRLRTHDHGVLATLHPDRGVDAVSVVDVVDEEFVGIPVDVVKPKASVRLQREQNLEADPRATLLVERFQGYREQPFDRMSTLRLHAVSGWAVSGWAVSGWAVSGWAVSGWAVSGWAA